MAVRRWWQESPLERYWLEITQRPDVGADLTAPQFDYRGNEYWSYALVTAVEDGDLVFHYEMGSHLIRYWSRASGGWWPDDVHWGARGTVGARRDAYDRPGWRHGLDGPFELESPVTLDDLRANEDSLQAVRDELLDSHGSPLYYPFELSSKRPLRTAQGYLFKLPAQAVSAFPTLLGAAHAEGTSFSSTSQDPSQVGTSYRSEDENSATSERDPFSVDPAVVERGLRGHAKTQNQLAKFLRAKGLSPRSHRPDEPAFDIAWEDGDTIYVCEVKSITSRNEERQLRLGLGQLLRYRHLLRGDFDVEAVLLAERQPSDPTWQDLCDALGVRLVWPQVLPERL